MRILFLTHSFNSLAQRLFVELRRRGHEVAIEFDINDAITRQAVALHRPDLVVAPFLKRAIPEAVWKDHVCLVVHPGIRGDRGPSALDWAILKDEAEWGVTVLQANAEMDAGDIWAWETFPMRAARKSSLYRNEVTEAAVRCVLTAVDRFAGGNFRPQLLAYADPAVRGRLHTPAKQADRALDWGRDDTATLLRKIRSGDGFPGVLDRLFETPYYVFDACAEGAARGRPGEIIGRRNGAILRASVDGALWIGHLKPASGGETPAFKLPATVALANRLDGVPELSEATLPIGRADTWREIWYEEADGVGYLHFDFYNGAMSSAQCERLRAAFVAASARDVRVLVLMGGEDYWSNGIHLNSIETAASPADESWRNINAMNDLARAIIGCERQVTISALQGNAGAGGVFLSLAADQVFARAGVVLNPHYKSMGNLFGSEYWTYLLPKRVGAAQAAALTGNRLPVGAPEAARLGLLDGAFGADREDFRRRIDEIARTLAARPNFAALLEDKRSRRAADEQEKPLAAYRDEEMRHMQLNFYGFDPSYHVARYNFVHKVPHAWTPLYLATHRGLRRA